MPIEVRSTAFNEGEWIPRKYTGEGEDVSPPISWSGIPDEAQEIVIVCDDPDAPTPEPWVHWLIYKIPAGLGGLPEGVPNQPRLKDPPGAMQGKNSWQTGVTIGYRGPMPPPGGPHRYYFKVYALDAKLVIEPGVGKGVLLEDIRDHILAEGQLMGLYER
ncbi:MAG: YbhB/YbcL family Raf kinase inhibitor-like protein [Thermoguttaceae bacterium]|jgi:Raf kinase inhibitor-like YbhB/YbcL family protein|nr:YbhB/YbcL family Raf kinase inhibitor-like protein [Thermoguttaceae bacterium]